MPRPRLLIPVLLATAALAGCGAQEDSGKDFSGEEGRVADVLADLQEAAQDDDPRRICDALLAPELKTKLDRGGEGCEKTVGQALDDADNYELDVQDVAITGNRATATVEGGTDKETERLTLVKAGDDWRLSGLGGAR